MNLINPKDSILQLTRSYQGERSADGRPHVSDDLLERMKLVSTEEAWGTLRRHGFNRQFEGGWTQVHPGKVLVGRAVTSQFVPHRPDLHELVEEKGKSEGRIGGQNSWVIDTLELGARPSGVTIARLPVNRVHPEVGMLGGTRGEIVRAGRSIVFLRGILTSAGRPLLTFSGTVKRINAPRKSA